VYGVGYKDLLSSKPGSSGRTMKSVMKALGMPPACHEADGLLSLSKETSARVSDVLMLQLCTTPCRLTCRLSEKSHLATYWTVWTTHGVFGCWLCTCAGVQRPNEQVEELVALFDAQTRRRVAAARRAHGARTQRFGVFQRVRVVVVTPRQVAPQGLVPGCHG
jgi:hypothetical protein